MTRFPTPPTPRRFTFRPLPPAACVVLLTLALLAPPPSLDRLLADDRPPEAAPAAPAPDAKPAAEPTAKPAAPPDAKPDAEPASVEQIAKRVRPSVVVVTYAGREGEPQGLGTGFVIDEAGLIATNLHVIGEARPIAVQLVDGARFDVTEVVASDRSQDLAIVRIDPRSKDKRLVALPLADDGPPPDGLAVVAVGNPHGLRHSVVSGVVSGVREVEGRRMIQLAIPIEPGNSGGPVVDRAGRVVGVVTMKSLVTENLGFAAEISALRRLLEKPNPVPMSRWLTIGVIDPRQWTTLFGARWRQRSGRIQVDGSGGGFGGRSLCLAKRDTPEPPFELAVTVKLNDERGAAGLVFHSDGGDKHFGFYPSGGKLRLSRFDGPDVFSWKVLAELPTEHYRPGDWNRLKVRIEKDGFVCYVNDRQVFESDDDTFTAGRVGLAKFRETQAEFKRFQVAKELRDERLDDARLAELQTLVEQLPSLDRLAPDRLRPLVESGPHGLTAVRRRAQELQRRAAELERVARDLHTQRVCAELREVAAAGERSDLLLGALLIARLDDEELDVDAYREQVDRLAAEVRPTLPADADPAAKLEALNKHLFVDNGFHGSRTDYYHRSNSYLSRVLDDREGLPITLSVLYMEVGRRLGLNLEGVPLPGHFCVRFKPADGEPRLIDVFDGGRTLTREQADQRVRAYADRPLQPADLEPASHGQILQRMLRNLIGVAQEARDSEALLRYFDALLTLDPEAIPERGMRAVVRFETGRRDAAVADLDWILERMPPDLDLDRIHQMRDYFLRQPR